MNQASANRERRAAKRVACETRARYQNGQNAVEAATVVNVDHGGLCLLLSQPLARGQRVMLEVDEPKRGDGSVEMKGQVAWCVPSAGGFRAGVRVYHDVADVRVALCALMCAALKQQAAVAAMRDRHFIYAEWKLAALEANDGANWIWKKRETAVGVVRKALAMG
ncbi:MAG: PilZ domain-containing protein [Candidatus Hydrogenedentes bacterium]|nr:PilZ domain-containing protein [Candidatus Hydrogenedentota bacterium]